MLRTWPEQAHSSWNLISCSWYYPSCWPHRPVRSLSCTFQSIWFFYLENPSPLSPQRFHHSLVGFLSVQVSQRLFSSKLQMTRLACQTTSGPLPVPCSIICCTTAQSCFIVPACSTNAHLTFSRNCSQLLALLYPFVVRILIFFLIIIFTKNERKNATISDKPKDLGANSLCLLFRANIVIWNFKVSACR